MNPYYEMIEKLLSDFVGFQTVNGDELPLAEYIANVLSKYGFETEIQNVERENRANVIASIGNSPKTLVFTGHLDVVPVDLSKDPDAFKLTKKDGRLYGRGSCDMKGGVAAMCAAAIYAKEHNLINDCTLKLVFVVDEELGGYGSEYYIRHSDLTPDTAIVIGEPSNLEAHIAHRGFGKIDVTLNGHQRHACAMDNDTNVLYASGLFLKRVYELSECFKTLKKGILPPPTLSATIINAGLERNVIPGKVSMTFDCRPTPDCDTKAMASSVENILKDLFDGSDITYSLEYVEDLRAALANEDGNLCKTVLDSYKKVFGKDITPAYFPACSDMSIFCNAGFKEVLICGPGSIKQAHTVGEYVSEEQLRKSVDMYVEIIKNIFK